MALLSFQNIVLLSILYLSCRVVYRIIYYRFFHPLASFPGPFWASVTRLDNVWHNIKEDECATYRNLHEQHGPVIRITPTLLLVNDSTMLPIIYNRNATKSQYYITGSFGKDDSLFNMRDAATHAKFRKVASAPYSFTNIKKMEPLVDEQIYRWVEQLGTRFTGEYVDFAPWAVYMAYDVVSSVGFGAPFGFIEQGKDVGGLAQGVKDGLVPFGVMARLYHLTSLAKSTFLSKYMVASPEQSSGVGAVMRFRDRLVEQRYKDIEAGTTNGRTDFLQTFIDARDENGKPLDPDYIKSEILIVLLAGAHTTGTTIQAFIFHLLTNTAAYDKLMFEIDEVTRSGKLSDPPQHDEVSNHCPYYIACLREAMRLNPAAPTMLPRLAPKGGLEIHGRFVPEGTELTCNPWIIHRDPGLYGEDADAYRPERWLAGDDKVKEYHKYNVAFGYGGRLCLGKDLAMMELFKGPLCLLRSFKLTLRNEQQPARYSVKGGVSYFEDMWVKIEKRAQVV